MKEKVFNMKGFSVGSYVEVIGERPWTARYPCSKPSTAALLLCYPCTTTVPILDYYDYYDYDDGCYYYYYHYYYYYYYYDDCYDEYYDDYYYDDGCYYYYYFYYCASTVLLLYCYCTIDSTATVQFLYYYWI